MNISSDYYRPTKPSIWQGRKDSLPHERYFQYVQLTNLKHQDIQANQAKVALIGSCTDVGIQRNEGRIGAKEGPDALRNQLGKLACHQAQSILDMGNLYCPDGDLEQTQNLLTQITHQCHQQFLKTIVIGGGHDIAWGHFSGLTQHYPDLAIINLDAHFDLRPVSPSGLGNSGTPFWQIATYCQSQNKAFNYLCLGIQPLANTHSLIANAQANHVQYLTAEAIHEQTSQTQINVINNFIKNKPAIYLSLCMDVFNEAVAPGVSAPQALGIFPYQAIPLLKTILQTGKVVGIDIAELSPPLDQGQKTSRLAAALLATMLECL